MRWMIFLSLVFSAHCTSLARDAGDVVCSESEDGMSVFVPHPTDCGLYYQCVGNNPVLMSCPDGLFFDPSLNVCNWPEFVDCESCSHVLNIIFKSQVSTVLKDTLTSLAPATSLLTRRSPSTEPPGSVARMEQCWPPFTMKTPTTSSPP